MSADLQINLGIHFSILYHLRVLVACKCCSRCAVCAHRHSTCLSFRSPSLADFLPLTADTHNPSHLLSSSTIT